MYVIGVFGFSHVSGIQEQRIGECEGGTLDLKKKVCLKAVCVSVHHSFHLDSITTDKPNMGTGGPRVLGEVTVLSPTNPFMLLPVRPPLFLTDCGGQVPWPSSLCSPADCNPSTHSPPPLSQTMGRESCLLATNPSKEVAVVLKRQHGRGRETWPKKQRRCENRRR